MPVWPGLCRSATYPAHCCSFVLFFKIFRYFILHVCVFVCMYVYAPHVCQCLQRLQRCTRSPGIRLTDGFEPPCGSWEPDLGPLQAQQMFLTAEFSFQPPPLSLFLSSCSFFCLSTFLSLSLLSDSAVLLCVCPLSPSSLDVPSDQSFDGSLLCVSCSLPVSEHPVFLQVQPLWDPRWRSRWPMQ